MKWTTHTTRGEAGHCSRHERTAIWVSVQCVPGYPCGWDPPLKSVADTRFLLAGAHWWNTKQIKDFHTGEVVWDYLQVSLERRPGCCPNFVLNYSKDASKLYLTMFTLFRRTPLPTTTLSSRPLNGWNRCVLCVSLEREQS